jgi:uncharacterized protein YeaO (DUF488 family)
MIKIKRVYDTVDGEDGVRFLVDRLWPRGIGKVALKADFWLKNVAPSAELRQWFGHDPAKWNDFRLKYFSELKSNPDGWQPIVDAGRHGTVTLLYSANDQTHNHAVALREFLRAHSTSAK